MKSITVGIVAVWSLAGCGVGVDDPEGQVAAKQEVARADERTPKHKGNNSVDPSWYALPQDPVPWFPVGQTAPCENRTAADESAAK
jgi:hypothetical protein